MMVRPTARHRWWTPCAAFTRNFGKEAALTAGLTFASGQAIIPIDCDLQYPPELIPAMLEQWRNGFQVVHYRRRDRTSDSRIKRLTAAAFYPLMQRIADVDLSADCGDFRLMDRRVVTAVLDHPERNRFMRGIMAAWTIFKTVWSGVVTPGYATC